MSNKYWEGDGNSFDYEAFISDSSDDYPKYSDGIMSEPIKTKEIIGDDYPTYEDSLKENFVQRNIAPPQQKDLDEDFLSCFSEVLRLAKFAIQPWWTEELKEKTQQKDKVAKTPLEDGKVEYS